MIFDLLVLVDALERPHKRLDHGRDRRHAANHADARRHARAVEVVLDRFAHDLRLLGDLGAETGLVAARLVGDDGERRLQCVREVADLRARAVDDRPGWTG